MVTGDIQPGQLGCDGEKRRVGPEGFLSGHDGRDEGVGGLPLIYGLSGDGFHFHVMA